MQAEKHLFVATPLLGRFLRDRAVERLFSSSSKEAAVALAGAVEKGHPEADAIFHRLLLLHHRTEPLMHGAVWNYWKTRRYEELLKRMQASRTLHSELLEVLGEMPENDWGNGVVFMLWSLLDRDDIAEQIKTQARHAPALEMDTLFGLAEGDPERYLSLEDPDFSVFGKAWLAASSLQRQRISTTVLKSQAPRLVAAYDRAVVDEHDPELVIEALKLCGDHDALFDRLHGLPFVSALDVIAFWEQNGAHLKDPSKRVTVEQAVDCYRELSELPPAAQPATPPGTRNIFSFWNERHQTDEELLQGLESPEPFMRAAAIFSGVRRGLIPRSRLREISLNGTWPEKLVLKLLLPEPDSIPSGEHVCWLRSQDTLAARILEARLPGSLEESLRLTESINDSSDVADPSVQLQQKLLQILSLLQGHFLRGLITVDSNDDAKEKNAVETEEIPDAEW